MSRQTDRRGSNEHYELTGAVYYAGAWKGALLLECSLAQAIAWGSRLMDASAPVAAEDARDSLGELCNVLAGNLKPLLPPGVGLSTPSVVKGADYSLARMRRHPVRAPSLRRFGRRFSGHLGHRIEISNGELGFPVCRRTLYTESSLVVRPPHGSSCLWYSGDVP